MPESHVSGTVTLIVLMMIVATIYGPWQWYCVDRARQKLFEIRARIFNLAAAGQIPFDSPQYRAIRDSVNIRLRFAHRMCWQQLMALAYPHSPQGSELKRQIRPIEDASLRAALEQEANKAARVMVELMILRSPFLLVTYALVKLYDRSPVGRRGYLAVDGRAGFDRGRSSRIPK